MILAQVVASWIWDCSFSFKKENPNSSETMQRTASQDGDQVSASYHTLAFLSSPGGKSKASLILSVLPRSPVGLRNCIVLLLQLRSWDSAEGTSKALLPSPEDGRHECLPDSQRHSVHHIGI